MMIEAILGVIKDKMNSIDVPYAFMRWTSTEKPMRYWVGEYSEVPTLTEDGYEEYSIILTGTADNSWLELMQDVAKIKDLFSIIKELRVSTDNGAAVIFYQNGFPVPTGEANLKRFQINLQIKAWKGI